MLDEIQNKSITKMVDRIIYDQGDPRFYLAEYERKREKETKHSPTLFNTDQNVILHRMAYMKMDQRKLNMANAAAFIFVIALTLTWNKSYIIFLFMSNFTAFDLMIIPGLFFYWLYRARYLKEEVNMKKLIIEHRVQSRVGSRMSNLNRLGLISSHIKL